MSNVTNRSISLYPLQETQNHVSDKTKEEISKIMSLIDQFKEEQADTKATLEASTATIDSFIEQFEIRFNDLTSKVYTIDRKVASLTIQQRISPSK